LLRSGHGRRSGRLLALGGSGTSLTDCGGCSGASPARTSSARRCSSRTK
jgi:hypothetical protein